MMFFGEGKESINKKEMKAIDLKKLTSKSGHFLLYLFIVPYHN